MTSKQITLRGIPAEVEEMVRKEAKRKGISLNRAFLSFIEREAGLGTKKKKKKVLYHDLDHLSGAWTKEEAAGFAGSLELQRKVDEALWKKTG